MNKFITIPLAIVFVCSLGANVYFLKNYDEEQLVEETKSTEYIQSLETELTTVKEALHVVSNNTNMDLNTTSLKEMTSLETAATTFIERIYNVNPDNYGYVKQEARHLMSKKLFETLYGAPGIDEQKINEISEVTDIEVYQHTKDKQAFVKYKLYTKQISSNYEIEENHMMILYFTTKNGELIVEAIEAVSDMGAI